MSAIAQSRHRRSEPSNLRVRITNRFLSTLLVIVQLLLRFPILGLRGVMLDFEPFGRFLGFLEPGSKTSGHTRGDYHLEIRGVRKPE